MRLKLPTQLVHDMSRYGYELAHDIPAPTQETKLCLKNILLPEEDSVRGEELLIRSTKICNLAGQIHAEWLMMQKDNIPSEWEPSIMLFAGTIWRHKKNKMLYLPAMWHTDDDWHFHIDPINNGFDEITDKYKLVCFQ